MKENNGITMNSYSLQIFPSNIPLKYSPLIFPSKYSTVIFPAPLLISLLIKKKIRNTKYTSTIQILTSLINTCKASHILNTTEQFLMLKAHDLAWETLSSTLNSFAADHSCSSPCFFVKCLNQTLFLFN